MRRRGLARRSFTGVRHRRRGRARVRARRARRHRQVHPAAGQLRRRCRPRRTRSISCRCTTGSRRCAGTSTAADIESYFLPENFKPIGATHEEKTGRPGLRLVYDSYGIPHVYGKTRADMAFGAGWTTARDRGLLIGLGRGPARVAVADVPGINAFWLVTSGAVVHPEPAGRGAGHRAAASCSSKTYGAKGRQIIADAQAYADGINAYLKAVNQMQDAAGQRERRDRRDRLHRLDLRRRRRGRGDATPSCSPSSTASSARCAATTHGTT